MDDFSRKIAFHELTQRFLKSICRLLWPLLLASTLVSTSAIAEEGEKLPQREVTPLPSRNLNPYILIFGMPPMESGWLTPAGEHKVDILFDFANNSIANDNPPESITLDGETYRLAVIWRRGITDTFEVGVEIPYITHSSGVMDDLIEGWHNLLGLSNNDRDDTPSNSLDYRYQWDGITLMGFTTGNSGIGDIRIFASKTVINSAERQIKASFSLKFPTGGEEFLHGSGDSDGALTLSGNDSVLLSRWKIDTYGQLGVLLIGQSTGNDLNLRSTLRRDAALFGGFGVSRGGYSLFKYAVEYKAQLQFHTPIYRNTLDQMNAFTSMLNIGGTLHTSDKSSIDLSIGEDLYTDTMPDFSITLAYRTSY